MTIDVETGTFRFEGLNEGGYVETYLTPTERDMIRPLAEPGQPLWKIQKGMLDYHTALIENIAMTDLATKAGVTKARSLSAEAKAVKWQYDMWERLLGAPELAEKQGT